MFNQDSYAEEVSKWPVSKIKEHLTTVRKKKDLATRRKDDHLLPDLNAYESILSVKLMSKSPQSYSRLK